MIDVQNTVPDQSLKEFASEDHWAKYLLICQYGYKVSSEMMDIPVGSLSSIVCRMRNKQKESMKMPREEFTSRLETPVTEIYDSSWLNKPDYDLKEYATSEEWEMYITACRYTKNKASEMLDCSFEYLTKSIEYMKNKASEHGYNPDTPELPHPEDEPKWVTEPDFKLEEFATAKQWEKYITSCQHNQTMAGEILGCTRQSIGDSIKAIKRNASKRGYAPGYDLKRKVPEGYTVKGASTYYDKDGNIKGQWVKSQASKEEDAERLLAFIAGATKNIVPFEEIEQPKGKITTDRMCCIPLPDIHMGLLCDQLIVGEGWDVKTSLKTYKTGIVELIDSLPATETVVISQLGDLAHQNDSSNMTPASGNDLDVDGRVEKTVEACAEFLVFTIDQCLKKFDIVDFRNILGNHSPDIEMGMNVTLKLLYRNNPRVLFQERCQVRDYVKFGRNIIGFTHWGKGKPEGLGLLMAQECREWWSDTGYSYFLTAHKHTMKKFETGGVVIESLRTLIPRDKFAFTNEYYSGRQLDAIIYDKECGECGRRIVDVKKIKTLLTK